MSVVVACYDAHAGIALGGFLGHTNSVVEEMLVAVAEEMLVAVAEEMLVAVAEALFNTIGEVGLR